MDDTLINQGFLWFFGAVFVGPLLGWLFHFVGGFEKGVAVGCLVIGLTGSCIAVMVGFDRAEQLRGTVAVEGRLVNFERQTTRDAGGEVSVSYEPRVIYVAADGKERFVTGLGGSQQSKDEGDAVPVRYWPDDPERAVVADFQNQWGAVLAFGLFGGFPVLFGLFFLLASFSPRPGGAAARGGEAKVRIRPDPLRRLWQVNLNRTAHATLWLSFIAMGFSTYGVAVTVGGGFCGVALGCLIFLISAALEPVRDWQAIGVLFILVVGFAVFGVGGLLLGLEV